jgi:phosphotransacetylase
MYTTCKLFVNYEVAKAIGRKLSDIHHPMYLLFFVCDVNDVVNIIMVKVGEARCIAK